MIGNAIAIGTAINKYVLKGSQPIPSNKGF
jgi:hypothetical protein